MSNSAKEFQKLGPLLRNGKEENLLGWGLPSGGNLRRSHMQANASQCAWTGITPPLSLSADRTLAAGACHTDPQGRKYLNSWYFGPYVSLELEIFQTLCYVGVRGFWLHVPERLRAQCFCCMLRAAGLEPQDGFPTSGLVGNEEYWELYRDDYKDPCANSLLLGILC